MNLFLRTLAGAALAGLAAGALAQASLPWQLEVGAGQESLARGLPDWRQTDLALRRTWAPRALFELNARRTERFGLRDSEWGVGVALPIDGAWDAAFSASHSPTHEVLPRTSASAGLQRQLGDGWVAGVTLRHTRYDSDRANALTVGADKYFGSAALGEWRAAAAVTATRLAGVAGSGSLRLQLDRYFGPRTRLGLLVTTGREVDRPGAGQALITDTQSVVLTGRWAVAPAWSLTGELGHTRLAERYRRSGGRLGVQLDF
jgi:YaiO family outer membrane protein